MLQDANAGGIHAYSGLAVAVLMWRQACPRDASIIIDVWSGAGWVVGFWLLSAPGSGLEFFCRRQRYSSGPGKFWADVARLFDFSCIAEKDGSKNADFIDDVRASNTSKNPSFLRTISILPLPFENAFVFSKSNTDGGRLRITLVSQSAARLRTCLRRCTASQEFYER